MLIAKVNKLLTFSFQKKCNKITFFDVILKWIGKIFFSSVLKEKSDNEIAKLAKKDLKYFSQIFERFFDRVYQFFYFRLRSREDAEDLASEAFEKIFQKLEKFEEKGLPFAAWIFKIAHHHLIDFLRKNKNKPISESIDEMLPSQLPSKDFDLTKIDKKVLSEKLWLAIKTLPSKHQEVWSLKLTNDLSHKEIAKILKTSEGNVNVIIHRSMERLKTKLSFLATP